MPWNEIVILVISGLFVGLAGGLLGIGGSVVMIPILVVLLGKNQHLAQASAMIVNVFVASPAAYRHQKARSVRWDAFARLLPFGIAMIVVGVWASNLFESGQTKLLTQIFGAFLIYVAWINIWRMYRRIPEPEAHEQRVNVFTCGVVGSITGFLAGLLGIGGGVIMVPLLQRICHLPLRQCIGTSSAVIILTAIVGALRKNTTLSQHVTEAGVQLDVQDSALIAACFIPTVVAGALIGARLTHALPLRYVRLAFILLLLVAAARMIVPAG